VTDAAGSLDCVGPGDRFKRVRTLLGLKLDEVVARSGKRIDRSRLIKIEKGTAKLTTQMQRDGMAHGLGLPRSIVDALIEGSVSVEDALAQLQAPSIPVGSSASQVPAATPAERGEQMATAIQLRDLPLARFPNLEFCLEYHRRGGKTWPEWVVAAARAGQHGDQDLPSTYAWEKALDDFHALAGGIQARKTMTMKQPAPKG
jgi:transcriptional regulator with XRE-family HTH domain